VRTRRDLQSPRSQLHRPMAACRRGQTGARHPSAGQTARHRVRSPPSPPLALLAAWAGGSPCLASHKGDLDPPGGLPSLLSSKQSIVQELVPYPSVVVLSSFCYPSLSCAHNISLVLSNTTVKLQANFTIILLAFPQPKKPPDTPAYAPRTSSSCSRITTKKVPPDKCIK
jgi:hypothetical protein